MGRPKAPALGIDLGTTHCCMAYINADGHAEVIRTRDHDRTMPSVVAFTKGGRIVGKRAKTDVERSDENTIFDAKRLLGCTFDDPLVQEDMVCWPFKVTSRDGLPVYTVLEAGAKKVYAPEQISGMVLEELKQAAQAFFGPDAEVVDAVITVPAYFNDDQRKATKAAAKIAGLNVIHMINEPTAAALAFGLKNAPKEQRNVLVFDLGGGTFDTVLLTHTRDELQVKNIGGDTHLGGQDFDLSLMGLALQEWTAKYPTTEIVHGSKGWRRLRLACEQVKVELSSVDEAFIDLSDVVGADQDLYIPITTDDFKYQCAELFDRCLDTLDCVLLGANFRPESVDDVVVVGGSSRMPKIRSDLRTYFPTSKLHMTDDKLNADEAVAIGAAIMAARKQKTGGDMPGMPADTGPAVIDAVPRTLGIEHGHEKKIHTLIKKGANLPAEGHQNFTTLRDNQTTILFQVFEGEGKIALDAHKLGEFSLPDIKPGPAGSCIIAVSMRIGEDGNLTTTATNTKTGKKADLVIKEQSRATDASVAEMAALAAAERTAKEEKQKKAPSKSSSRTKTSKSSSRTSQ